MKSWKNGAIRKMPKKKDLETVDSEDDMRRIQMAAKHRRLAVGLSAGAASNAVGMAQLAMNRVKRLRSD